MKIKNAHERLAGLRGLIEDRHNALIEKYLDRARKILDVGCGYGSCVHYLTHKGYEIEGIDSDEGNILIAKSLYPHAAVRAENAEKMEFYPLASYDAVILKNSMHHLVGEGDYKTAFRYFRKILKNNGRLIITDPNPNFILRSARKVIAHKDPELSPETAVKILEEEQFHVKTLIYFETLGIALSGGYVGVRLVPNWRPLNHLIANLNDVFAALANSMGLGKCICWRYLIAACKQEVNPS